jgi:hypothetical protein
MKKNIRKVPPNLRARLDNLQNEVVAGIARTYTTEDLTNGQLGHLGVQLLADGLRFPEAMIPPAGRGKYSDRNINGYEVIRRDLPKETHYNTIEAPDWGDASNGTHWVDLPYEKYPRDFYGPPLASIRISSPNADSGRPEYTLMFEIDQVLKQDDPEFESHLIIALNLLQENIGGCGIQNSGATFADYIKTMTVSWEVLPPGTREEAVQRLFRNRQPSEQERALVEERYDFLMGLNPEKLVFGMSGIQRYFGALIQENLVVFENIQYGNAIYIMFDDWQKLSKRSRTELLSGRFGRNFERITHGADWKNKVKTIIESAIEPRNQKAKKQYGK